MPLDAEVDLGPGDTVLDGDQLPSPKMGTEPPNFRPIFIVAKRLDATRCHLIGMEVGLGPGDFVFDGDPAPHKKGTVAPIFGPCLWPNG